MPDTDDIQKQILDAARTLGDLVAKHPVLKKYADAQKSLSEDPEAGRLLQEFDRKAAVVMRNEQVGQMVTEAERRELETLQTRIAGNLKVKAFSIAQTDLTDLLRKVSQTWQRPVAEAQGETPGGGSGPRVTM